MHRAAAGRLRHLLPHPGADGDREGRLRGRRRPHRERGAGTRLCSGPGRRLGTAGSGGAASAPGSAHLRRDGSLRPLAGAAGRCRRREWRRSERGEPGVGRGVAAGRPLGGVSRGQWREQGPRRGTLLGMLRAKRSFGVRVRRCKAER